MKNIMLLNLLKLIDIAKCLLLTNKWLIIASVIAITFSSCIPAIDKTTGTRISKQEFQNNAKNYSYSKSRKYNLKPINEQYEQYENIEKEVDVDNALADFENRLNIANLQNDKTIEELNENISPKPKSKTLSLEEQFKKINDRQYKSEEDINNIKGELLEIKEMLYNITNENIKISPGKENKDEQLATKLPKQSNIEADEFIISSEEEQNNITTAPKPTPINKNIKNENINTEKKPNPNFKIQKPAKTEHKKKQPVKSVNAQEPINTEINNKNNDINLVNTAEEYLKAGKNNEAKAAYQTLLKEYPKSSHSAKAKKMLQQL